MERPLPFSSLAMTRFTGPGAPTRLVFDEGHHVFDAADGAFSAYLSGRETAELRRWLRGGEGCSLLRLLAPINAFA